MTKGTEDESPSIIFYDVVTTYVPMQAKEKEKDLIEKMEHDGCERN
jgi:hypothetical protein